MAIKDVKAYYYQMQAQYLEMKADLTDFEQAFANGFISEEDLVAAKEAVAVLETNYDRLSFIMYLLEMPNRPSKKKKYSKENRALVNLLAQKEATEEAVKTENISALTELRKELKKLTQVDSE